MNKKTWLKEFYPVPAHKVSAEDALDHSIKKWEGALEENLEKHGLDCPPMGFYSDSCALCAHYYMATDNKPVCGGCPLFMVRGNVKCYVKRPCEEMSPFNEYNSFSNPRPMLTWLKKAKEMK